MALELFRNKIERNSGSSNVDFIGPYTFNYCSNLKKVVLSDNITTISYRAFNHCKCLTDIKLPSKLSVIGEEAFADSGIREIHIPMGTRKIMRSAFSNNPLTAAYIPPTIKEIGDANADSILEIIHLVAISPDILISRFSVLRGLRRWNMQGKIILNVRKRSSK